MTFVFSMDDFAMRHSSADNNTLLYPISRMVSRDLTLKALYDHAGGAAAPPAETLTLFRLVLS